jgi:hypothetical protein
MMKSSTRRIFFGAALILVGALFLIKQLFAPQLELGGIIVAAVFAIAAAAFLYVLITNHENWWAAIPGMVLLGLSALIACGELFPRFEDKFGGSMFLAFIGLAFLVVLLVKHENWWAVIPAGVMFTLAAVAAMGEYNFAAGSSVFFLGIALTFGIVGLMPIGRKEKWPWIPAGICAILGTMLMIGSGEFLDSYAGLVWPAILLVAGGYLIVRTFIRKDQ